MTNDVRMRRLFRFSLASCIYFSVLLASVFLAIRVFDQYHLRSDDLQTLSKSESKTYADKRRLGETAHRAMIEDLPEGNLEHWRTQAKRISSGIAEHAFKKRFPFQFPGGAVLCNDAQSQIHFYGLDAKYGIAVRFTK